ncbi:MAG: glutamine amidotransferase [Lachnospiraceae bacterium]|nr:glutamine amidotransferase [Lachnospiraceae bacterium]
MSFNIKRKILSFFLIFIIAALPLSGCLEQKKETRVGIAWRSDQTAESFTATVAAVEEAGGEAVVLDMVKSKDLNYDGEKLLNATLDNGCLSEEAANSIKSTSWQNSNVKEVVGDLEAIVFPGGEDISPTLIDAYKEEDVKVVEGYSAERDVSDYLLMSYCLDNDLAVLAICRGMQLLSVVSGASIINDIPTYFNEMGIEYNYEHRNEPESPGAYRDFSFHDVKLTDKDSLLYSLVKNDVIKDVPSWHHQAVKDIENTKLKVTAIRNTCGVDMIEAVERPDKSFVLGLQFHPEIAVVRGLDDLSICYFKAIVSYA